MFGSRCTRFGILLESRARRRWPFGRMGTLMDFYPDRATVYASALRDLDRLSHLDRAGLRSHDIAGEYGTAIVNVAKLFEVGVDVVVCDLQGIRSQVAA